MTNPNQLAEALAERGDDSTAPTRDEDLSVRILRCSAELRSLHFVGASTGATRHATAATLESFALYIARRHQRWLDAFDAAPTIAPCVIGSSRVAPCWQP